MQIKLFILTFDYFKDGYPDTPYSIASILASIKNNSGLNNVQVFHESVNLSILHEKYKNDNAQIEKQAFIAAKKIVLDKCWDANYLAIGITAWSEVFIKKLLPFITNNFKGKLIAGGYEVTAIDDNTIKKEYPGFHFYIKGYSETAIGNILSGKHQQISESLVISEKIELDHLNSPYLNKVIPITRKVHWETKRGCPYTCGFCEWGNASQKKVYFLPIKRLKEEVLLFKSSGVKEINILDGTFNFGKSTEYDYVTILELVLKETNAHISLQVRFEGIKSDLQSKRFLELCIKYKNRLTLEFGLQTIHFSEMEVIGRKNDLLHIRKIIKLLLDNKVNIEISIIYGIPGQTLISFMETIEFILKNKCEKIFAYPLRIPRNSKMEKDKERFGVSEEYNQFNVKSTVGSFSFNKEDYSVMNQFRDGLQFLTKERTLLNPNVELVFILMKVTPQNTIKLVKIEKEFRLKFYPANDLQRKKISGNVYKILQLAATKEINTIAQYGKKAIKEFGVPNAFFFAIEAITNAALWHYIDIDGKEYCCFLRISSNGNIYIFKHFLPLN